MNPLIAATLGFAAGWLLCLAWGTLCRLAESRHRGRAQLLHDYYATRWRGRVTP